MTEGLGNKTKLEGKFSLQFTTAIILIDGKVGISQLTDEKVLNPKTQALMKKITVKVDPEIKQRFTYQQSPSQMVSNTLSEPDH